MTVTTAYTKNLTVPVKRVEGENDDDVIEYELGQTHHAALDMKGVVIREVSGPALRGGGQWITHDSHR